MTESPSPPAAEPDDFPDAERIIDAFGGVRPMASRLGVAATTVQGWKTRGTIPPPRREEVRQAASAASIDLAGIPAPAPADEETAEEDAAVIAGSPETPVQSPAPRAVAGVMGVAISVLVSVAVTVASYPVWQPLIDGRPAQADVSSLIARIAALEARPPTDLTDVTARIAALEGAAGPDLQPVVSRIDTLESRLSTVEETAAQQESPAAALQEITARIDAVAAQQTEGRSAINSLAARLDAVAESAALQRQSQVRADAAEVASLKSELASLKRQVGDPKQGDAAVGASAAALVLAVTTLEAAMRDGAAYRGPLSIVERFAAQDAALAQSAAALLPHAGKGIPAQPALMRELTAVLQRMGTPLWSETGVAWVDKMLREIDGLVTIRRVGDIDGRQTAVADAEKALAANDLPAAIAALDGLPGLPAEWVLRAKARVVADSALSAMRLRAIGLLGAPQAGQGKPE